jgi:hypothetical protein
MIPLETVRISIPSADPPRARARIKAAELMVILKELGADPKATHKNDGCRSVCIDWYRGLYDDETLRAYIRSMLLIRPELKASSVGTGASHASRPAWDWYYTPDPPVYRYADFGDMNLNSGGVCGADSNSRSPERGVPDDGTHYRSQAMPSGAHYIYPPASAHEKTARRETGGRDGS